MADKRIRVVVEVVAPVTEKALCRIVADNLPRDRNGVCIRDDKRLTLGGSRRVSVKAFSRVVGVQRRLAGEQIVDLSALSPKHANAVRALVRSLTDE